MQRDKHGFSYKVETEMAHNSKASYSFKAQHLAKENTTKHLSHLSQPKTTSVYPLPWLRCHFLLRNFT